MKRRNFIKALGATTAVATLGSKRAQADAKKYKWKMVTSWPKNFPGLGVGAENLAKMINDLSGGRIKIKVFGANELVPPLGVFDFVSEGGAAVSYTHLTLPTKA